MTQAQKEFWNAKRKIELGILVFLVAYLSIMVGPVELLTLLITSHIVSYFISAFIIALFVSILLYGALVLLNLIAKILHIPLIRLLDSSIIILWIASAIEFKINAFPQISVIEQVIIAIILLIFLVFSLFAMEIIYELFNGDIAKQVENN